MDDAGVNFTPGIGDLLGDLLVLQFANQFLQLLRIVVDFALQCAPLHRPRHSRTHHGHAEWCLWSRTPSSLPPLLPDPHTSTFPALQSPTSPTSEYPAPQRPPCSSAPSRWHEPRHWPTEGRNHP